MDIKLGIKKIKEENNIKGKEIDLNQNKKFETEYLTRDEFIKKQKKKKKKFKPSTLLIPIEEKNKKRKIQKMMIQIIIIFKIFILTKMKWKD